MFLPWKASLEIFFGHYSMIQITVHMDDLKPDSEEEDEEDFLEEMDIAFSQFFSDSACTTMIGSDTSCEMFISVSCWWLSSSEDDLSTAAVASRVGVSGKGLGTSTTTAFESESDMVSPKLFWHKIWSFLELASALSRDSVSDDDEEEEEDPDFAAGSFGTIPTTGFPSESLSTRIKGVNINVKKIIYIS